MTENLAQIQLFQGLSDDQREEIKGLVEDIEFYNRERVFKDGDKADYLWFVREGRVDLRFDLPSRDTSNECTVSTVIKDGALGWSSLVAPYEYKLSAYCEADYVCLARIEREPFLKLLSAHPEIGFKVMGNLAQVIATRFHDLQEEVATQMGHNIMNHW